MNFPACTYKSQHFAQSQLSFALSHGGETVTFRNSDYVYQNQCWPDMYRPF